MGALEVDCIAVEVVMVDEGAGLFGLSEELLWRVGCDGIFCTGNLLWILIVIFCFLGCSGITEGLLTGQSWTDVEALTGPVLLTLEFPLGLAMELLGISFKGPVPFRWGGFWKQADHSQVRAPETVADSETWGRGPLPLRLSFPLVNNKLHAPRKPSPSPAGLPTTNLSWKSNSGGPSTRGLRSPVGRVLRPHSGRAQCRTCCLSSSLRHWICDSLSNWRLLWHYGTGERIIPRCIQAIPTSPTCPQSQHLRQAKARPPLRTRASHEPGIPSIPPEKPWGSVIRPSRTAQRKCHTPERAKRIRLKCSFCKSITFLEASINQESPNI